MVSVIKWLLLLPNIGIFDEVRTILKSESSPPGFTPTPPPDTKKTKKKQWILFFCLTHFSNYGDFTHNSQIGVFTILDLLLLGIVQ